MLGLTADLNLFTMANLPSQVTVCNLKCEICSFFVKSKVSLVYFNFPENNVNFCDVTG